MRVELSENYIQHASYNGGTDLRWDTEQSGLALRIYPSGRKVFLIRVGSSRRILGRCGVLSLDEARETCKRLQLGHGSNSKQILFSELCDYYLEYYAKTYRRSWKEDARRISSYLKPWFGSTRVDKVRPIDCIMAHSKLSARAPVEANRVIQLLRRIYALAESWELYEGRNPGRGVRLNTETSRSRFLTSEELFCFFRALHKDSEEAYKYFLLLLLTGLRKSELSGLRWTQCKDNELQVPDAKSQREKRIALSAYARRVLFSLPKQGDRVFPQKSYRRQFRRARKYCGLDCVTIHDIRRTFASHLLELGYPLDVVQKALAHSSMRSTLIYAQRADRAVSEAVEELSEHFSSLLQIS